MNKIKLLLIPFISLIPLTIIPFTSSCVSLSSTKMKLIGEVGVNGKMEVSNTNYNSLKTSTSIKDLFYGTNSVDNGNYVILFASLGATAAPTNKDSYNPTDVNANQFYPNDLVDRGYANSNKSLFSMLDPTNDYDKSTTENLKVTTCNEQEGLIDGINSSYASWITNYTQMKVKVFLYVIDFTKITYGLGNNKKDIYVSPFYKWQDTDTNNNMFNPSHAAANKKGNSDEKWAYSHKSGSYAANDSYSKEIRGMFDKMNTLMPDCSLIDTSLETSVISISYVRGIAKKHDIYTAGATDYNCAAVKSSFDTYANENYK